MEETKVYNYEDFEEAIIEQTLKEVISVLRERGYNPINQIVGYLISGDPGYISNHRDARSKITKFDRSRILEIIIKKYLEK